jgi:hypothetical protein
MGLTVAAASAVVVSTNLNAETAEVTQKPQKKTLEVFFVFSAVSA